MGTPGAKRAKNQIPGPTDIGQADRKHTPLHLCWDPEGYTLKGRGNQKRPLYLKNPGSCRGAGQLAGSVPGKGDREPASI